VLNHTCEDATPFPQAHHVEHIKLFLQWLVRGSIGLLDEKMTDITVGNYLSVLTRAVKLHTYYQYNKLQNQELAAVHLQSLHH